MAENFGGLGPSPRGVLRKNVIPGELQVHGVQECDSRGVSGNRFARWMVRRAYRSSVLGKRCCDLEAGDDLMAIFCFVVRCHWWHVAMSGTSGQEITFKLLVTR